MSKKFTVYEVCEYYIATGEGRSIKCFTTEQAAKEFVSKQTDSTFYHIRRIDVYE